MRHVRTLGDDVATLYARHQRRLRGLALAITLDRSAAEEIVNDAFLGITARIERIDNPAGYLQRSVVNQAIDHVRRRERARALPQEPLLPTTIPDIDEAWSLVAELPAAQRAVVVLRFWEDLTQEQIAGALELPLGTVKSTLHRALTTLRRTWPAPPTATRRPDHHCPDPQRQGDQR